METIELLKQLKQMMNILSPNEYIEVLFKDYYDDNVMDIEVISLRNDKVNFKKFSRYIDEAIKYNDPIWWITQQEDNVNSKDVPYILCYESKLPVSYNVKRYKYRSGAYWCYTTEYHKHLLIDNIISKQNYDLLQTHINPDKHCLIKCIPELEPQFNKYNYNKSFDLRYLNKFCKDLNISVNIKFYHEQIRNDKLVFSAISEKHYGSDIESADRHVSISYYDRHFFEDIKIAPIKLVNARYKNKAMCVAEWMKYLKNNKFVTSRSLELKELEADVTNINQELINKLCVKFDNDDVEKYVQNKNKYKIYKIYAADCESYPLSVRSNCVHKKIVKRHFPYAIGVYSEGEFKYFDTRHVKGLLNKFKKYISEELRYIPDNYVSIMYFHNAKFDLSLTISAWKIKGYDLITTQTNGKVYRLTIIDKKTRKQKFIVFDSYKLMNYPLSKFHNIFNLDIRKIDYNISKITNWREFCLNKPAVIEYLKYDCMVLYESMLKYAEIMKQIVSEIINSLANGNENYKNALSLYKHSTISSLSFGLIVVTGCLQNVYSTKGVLQAYLMKALRGGRVQLSNNNPFYIKKKIIDLDVNSLYPAAMLCMEGLPMGIPKYINKESNNDWSVCTYKITKLNPKHIGIIAINQKQNLEWICESTNKDEYIGKYIVISNVIRNELVKYCDFEYEFIGGLQWNEGTNDTLSKLITLLYEWRLKIDKNSSLGKVIKLVMNSVYGKFIQKPNSTKIKLDFSADELRNSDDMIRRTHYYATEYTAEFIITEYEDKKAVNEYASFVQCGIKVLDYSKLIMNDYIFNYIPNNIPNSKIVYTDTDSMFIIVDDEFDPNTLTKYDLNKIGLLSTDFNDQLYGVEMLALAPKTYYLKMNDKSECVVHKGIGEKTILETAKSMNYNSVIHMMLENVGKKIRFNLSKYQFTPRYESHGWGGCFEPELVRTFIVPNLITLD